MRDIALVNYTSLDKLLDDASLETHKHMIKQAYKIGFKDGSSKKMTNEQRILGFMRNYKNKNGVNPTLKEIMVWLGAKSLTTVQRALLSLEKKGEITRDKFHKRAWKLVIKD